MYLKRTNSYRITPGGICLTDEAVSLKMEFVAENIFRMWTTLHVDFRQEETLVVERTAFDCPGVCVNDDHFAFLSEYRTLPGFPSGRSPSTPIAQQEYI